MNQTKRTLTYCAAAILFAALAWVASPSRITPDAFLDQGEPFFPEFTDPNEATSLEILSFDAETGSARPFKVHFRDGRWTIPSHHDYPADAQDRLAKTAAGIIDLAKDDFRTNSPADFDTLGVVDPLDDSSPSLTGRGTRVTVRGQNDVILADILFGRDVPGRPGMKFVRIPNQKRVYAVRSDVDLSGRFSDWIRTDLLEVTRARINRVEINDYSINERTRRVEERDRITLSRKADGSWTINNLGSGRALDTIAVDRLLDALDSLAIVGVRPKPEGLSKSLSASASQPISQADVMSLQSKGFFLSQDGQLLSNEGELKVYTDDGVIYTLRFGEVLFGAGVALTAGTDAHSESTSKEQESRYLFVTTNFNDRAFAEPPRPANEDFRSKADSVMTDEDRRNRDRAREHDQWKNKVERGRQLTERLNTRFADWYYVISGASFGDLKRDHADLTMAAN